MKQSKITFNLQGLDNLRKQASNYRARVGILGDKAEEVHKNTTLTNSEIAIIQIWGSFTNNIPPRDFLLMPVEYNQREIVKDIGASGKIKAAASAGNFKEVLKQVGFIAEKFVDKAFETSGFGQWAPNAPSTIAAKGSSKPLINISQLRRAVASKVVRKGEA